MKSIIFIILAQLIAFADACLLPQLRENLKTNPTFLRFFAYNIFPILLIGILLALAAMDGIKKKHLLSAGISAILLNALLLFSYFKGYFPFASHSIPLLLFFIGYGFGMTVNAFRRK